MFRASTLVLIVAAVLALVSLAQAAAIEARSSSYSGKATFYSVNHSGKPSCGGNADNNDMVAALSNKRIPHGRGKPCGEKIKIHGPNGSITVKVIDTCDGCGHNDVDLSPKAFEKIAKKKDGEVKIKWSFN